MSAIVLPDDNLATLRAKWKAAKAVEREAWRAFEQGLKADREERERDKTLHETHESGGGT